MERFLIITNLEKDTNLKVTYQIDEYLKNKGKQSIRCERDDMGMMIADRVPKEIDCAIVIGGDGTMIRAARELVELQIPILGVNMGTLGYLTEVELKDIEMALECILKKEYELEDRMMLSGHFEDGSSAHALNDIVVSRSGSIHIVDFHAEATAEKIALGYYLDGEATIIFGTHTHVQTADEKILENGTAYVTDIGMTGPKKSVIGMDVDASIKRFVTSLPEKYRVAEGKGMFNSFIFEIDDNTNKVKKIDRYNK